MPYGFDIPNPTPAAGAASSTPGGGETFGDIMGLMPQTSKGLGGMPGMDMGIPMEAAPAAAPQTPAIPGRPYVDPSFLQEQEVREDEEQNRLIAEVGPTNKEAAEKGSFGEPVYSPDDDQAAIDEVEQILNPTGAANPKIPGRNEFSEDPESVADRARRFAANPGQFLKDQFKMVMARGRAGLGETTSQKARGFAGVWNDPESGAAVAFKDGKPYVKYPNSKGYIPVGGQKWDILASFFLDNSAKIIDAGLNMAPLMIPGVGPEAGLAQRVAGRAAQEAGAGMLGKVGVKLAQEGMDAIYGNDQVSQKESEQFISDALLSAGINVATAGAFQVAAKGGGAAVSGFKQLASGISDKIDPIQRVFNLSEVKNRMASIVDEIGGAEVGKSMRDVALGVHGMLDGAVTKMASQIANVEGKALALADKDAKFMAPNVLDAMKRELENYGAIIDPKTGVVKLPDDAALTRLTKARSFFGEAVESAGNSPEAAKVAEQATDVLGKLEHQAAVGDIQMRTAVGDARSGRKRLEELGQMYESMFRVNAMGGAPLDVVFKTLDSFKNLAEYETDGVAPELAQIYRRLYNAGVQDRAVNLQRVLGGTGLPEEKLMRKAYRQYTENVDEYSKVIAAFKNQRSAENFVKSVGTSSEYLRTVKTFLGEGSEMWGKFRGEYLNKMVQDATDQTTGIFKGSAFLEALGKMPQDTRNQMFSGQELKQLQRMARVAETIPYSDLLSKAQKDAITTLAGLPGLGGFLTTFVRSAFSIFGRNRSAMEYLAENALHKKALAARTAQERQLFSNAEAYVEEVLKKMDTTSVSRTMSDGTKRLVRVLVPPARLAQSAARQRVTSPEVDRTMETGVFLQPPADEGI